MATADSIVVLTDYSRSSEVSFDHALALAVSQQAELSIVHVGGGEGRSDRRWDKFPGVREKLSAWGMLPVDSRKEDVFEQLGVKVQKVNLSEEEVAKGAEKFIRQHKPDLVIMSSTDKSIFRRIFGSSLSEKLVRDSSVSSLVTSQSAMGFIDSQGKCRVNRILVPIATRPSPSIALEAALDFAVRFCSGEVEIKLLHVGRNMRSPKLASVPANIKVVKKIATGDVLKAIISESDTADLIVMSTKGADSFSDELRGTVTNRVVRRAGCPVLVLPVL